MTVYVCIELYVLLPLWRNETIIIITEAQLSPSNRAMRLVSSNLANYNATVHKLLIRQVLTKPMV